MRKRGPLLEKSFAFGLRMFGLNELLIQKKLYAAADQVFRSGTSIGANAEEAMGGVSRKDFLAKLGIAYKEARETHYWLRLLEASHTLEPRLAASLLQDAEELQKILAAIIVSTCDGKRPLTPTQGETERPNPQHENDSQLLTPNS